MVRRILGLMLLTGTTVAHAQIAPGLRMPENIAEGVAMAQLLGCTGAASERPADGLNMPLRSDLVGVAMHNAMPAALSGKLGQLSSGSRIMTLDTPEGPVWMAYDAKERRCFVTAVAPSPEDVRTKLLPLYESEKSPWKALKGSAHATPAFEWFVRATPALGTPAVKLTATIDIPAEPNSQLVLTTQASNP